MMLLTIEAAAERIEGYIGQYGSTTERIAVDELRVDTLMLSRGGLVVAGQSAGTEHDGAVYEPGLIAVNSTLSRPNIEPSITSYTHLLRSVDNAWEGYFFPQVEQNHGAKPEETVYNLPDARPFEKSDLEKIDAFLSVFSYFRDQRIQQVTAKVSKIPALV
jgi:hypothetical protein